MITFKKLIEDIKFYIKKNGKQAITGDILQQRLVDMVGKTEEVYAEDRERLNTQDGDIAELQGAVSELDRRVTENGGSIANNKDRIDGIDAKIVLIDEKDAEQDANIQVNADNILKIDGDIESINQKDLQQDGKIAENALAIQANEQGIAGLVKEVERLDTKDAEQDARIKSNEDDIKELYETTQIKDLDVEIRNVGGDRYISSDSADTIYNYAIKGGNVKIQINDKKYEFVTYKQRTAYFRYLAVMADKVMEEDIEIYGTDATFKTIEYEAVFDATPLLTSFTGQTPLPDAFVRDLDNAINERKLIFVKGNGSIYLLTGTSKSGDMRTFTGIGRNTVYVLSYGTSKIVSLDANTIGADIHIFNNENSVNILNLTAESTNEEIKEVFTDSTGEVIIPHANDIFYIYQNADVANNGSVESMVEDAYEIRLAVNMSNFENNLIHRVFYNISYDANVGVNSLRITSKVDNIIDPSKLTETEIDKLNTKAEKGVTALGKAEKVAGEINEYNISKLNQSVYDLQGAISALNEYLGGGSRSFGMKVTFIDSSEMIPKTFKFVKGTFTSTLSWEEVVPYRVINQLVCGLDRFGHASGLSVDIEDMYRICGFDLILYGHGSPSALTIPKQKGVPAFIGQVYIDLDASNNGRYYSKGTHSVADWTK